MPGLTVVWSTDPMNDEREVTFTVPVPPVSQQSSGKRKKNFRRSVESYIPKKNWLFTDDAAVDIIWRCSETHKYENHKSIDIDNIIKPIVDAIAGSLLVDDTQLTAVSASWVDWEAAHEGLEVSVKSPSGNKMSKDEFEFVHFERGMCFPLCRFPREDGSRFNDYEASVLKKSTLEHIEAMMRTSSELKRIFPNSNLSRLVLPVQRFFHRNKVKARWSVHELADKLKALEEIIAQCNQDDPAQGRAGPASDALKTILVDKQVEESSTAGSPVGSDSQD